MIDFFEQKEFSRIAKYFPGIVILLGIVKLLVYYSVFNINIIDFIDITEVFISCVDKVILIFSFTIIPILIVLSIWGKKIGESNNEEFKKISELTFFDRLWKSLTKSYLLTISGIAYTFILIFRPNTGLLAIYIFYPGIYILFYLVNEVRIGLLNQYQYKIPVTYINTFLLTLLLTFNLIHNTLNEAIEVKEKYKYFGTMIYCKTDTVKCDSNKMFIGQSQKYVFIHQKNNQNLIIPKSEITKLVIVEK